MKSIPDADGRNGVAANTTHYRPPGDDPDRKVQPQARLLLADTSIAFRYFGVATARGAAQWSDSWGSPDSFPELVEVSFAPTGAGSRRVLLVPLRLRPAP